MSAANLADRIRMNRRSRSPVQDTVDGLFDEITEAMAGGGSFRTVHAQLTREGHNVGKSHTSLFAAYQVLQRRRYSQSAAAPQTTVTKGRQSYADAAADEPASSSFGRMPTVVIDSRRNIKEW